MLIVYTGYVCEYGRDNALPVHVVISISSALPADVMNCTICALWKGRIRYTTCVLELKVALPVHKLLPLVFIDNTFKRRCSHTILCVLI